MPTDSFHEFHYKFTSTKKRIRQIMASYHFFCRKHSNICELTSIFVNNISGSKIRDNHQRVVCREGSQNHFCTRQVAGILLKRMVAHLLTWATWVTPGRCRSAPAVVKDGSKLHCFNIIYVDVRTACSHLTFSRAGKSPWHKDKKCQTTWNNLSYALHRRNLQAR